MGLACILTGHNYVKLYTRRIKYDTGTCHGYRCTKCGDTYEEIEWDK